MVQNEDSVYRAETEASPLHQVSSEEFAPIQIRATPNSEFNDFDDSDLISIVDFQHFFGQMNTEYDVGDLQTVLSFARFSNPRIRPSKRDRIDRQSDLEIFKELNPSRRRWLFT